MSDAIDFLHAWKLLKIDIEIFWWVWSSIPKVPKIQSLQKEVRDEIDCLDADKHQSFLQVDFNTLGIKVFDKVIGMIMKTWRAWWWAWSSILKVIKVTSLQCLCNMEFIMEFIKIKTSTSWIIGFWWKADMSTVPKKGSLLSFCNILRKRIVTVFMFYCDAKHSDTLRGSSHVCYLFLQTFQPSRFYEVSPGFWYAVPVSGIESICPGFYISQQQKFHI